jgi:hypothetical protein
MTSRAFEIPPDLLKTGSCELSASPRRVVIHRPSLTSHERARQRDQPDRRPRGRARICPHAELRERHGRAALETPEAAPCAAAVVHRRVLAQRGGNGIGESLHRRRPGQADQQSNLANNGSNTGKANCPAKRQSLGACLGGSSGVQELQESGVQELQKAPRGALIDSLLQ